MIIVKVEPGFRRAEFTAADAAGVVTRPRRRVARSLENRIGQKTTHRDQYGQGAVGWQGCGASCGPAARLSRAGLRQAQARNPAKAARPDPASRQIAPGDQPSAEWRRASRAAGAQRRRDTGSL